MDGKLEAGGAQQEAVIGPVLLEVRFFFKEGQEHKSLKSAALHTSADGGREKVVNLVKLVTNHRLPSKNGASALSSLTSIINAQRGTAA